MKSFGYPRAEKLKRKSQIDELFEHGKWHGRSKLRIIIYKTGGEINQVGVSASKKNFKKAVDRNRTKRLLREAYRLNKPAFAAKFGVGNIALLFWNAKEVPTPEEVFSEYLELLKK